MVMPTSGRVLSIRDGKKLYEGFKSYAKMGRGESSMIVRKYV